MKKGETTKIIQFLNDVESARKKNPSLGIKYFIGLLKQKNFSESGTIFACRKLFKKFGLRSVSTYSIKLLLFLEE